MTSDQRIDHNSINHESTSKATIQAASGLGFLTLLTIGVLLAWALVAGIIDTIAFVWKPSLYFLLVFVVILVLGFFFTYRITRRIFYVLSGLFISLSIYSAVFVEEATHILYPLHEVIHGTYQYILGYMEYSILYERVIVGTIAFIFSFVIVLFLYVRFTFLVLFTLSTITYIILLSSNFFDWMFGFLIYAICMMYLFLCAMIRNQKLLLIQSKLHSAFGHKIRNRYNRVYLRHTLPFLCICLLLAGFIQAPEEPVLEGRVQQAILTPFDEINHRFYLFAGGDPTLGALSGFARGWRTQLGSDLTLCDNLSFRMFVEEPLPIYYPIQIFSTYTGNAWEGRVSDDTIEIEQFLQIPDEFPIRVQELFESITSENSIRIFSMSSQPHQTYQLLQLLLIEDFLRTNYRYSLSPGLPPDDVDFIEHFLFDSQSGYCVHFATTFVMMARLLGFPARYIEGYLIQGEPDADGYIDVLNNMAHAWPEVLMQGHGWVRFEPTPGYMTSHVPRTDHTLDAPIHDPVAIQNEWNANPMERDFDTFPMDQNNTALTNVSSANTSSTGTIILRILVWCGLLLLVAMMLGVARIVWVKHKASRRKQMLVQQKVLSAFDSILAYLQLHHMEFVEEQSVRQNLKHITTTEELRDPVFAEMLHKTMLIYEKARFSQEEIHKQEYRKLLEVLKILDTRMLKKQGRIRYVWNRYILAVV